MTRKPGKTQQRKTARTTISMPHSDYEQLEHIADYKKVSIAWVVRDAIERYLCSEPARNRNTQK